MKKRKIYLVVHSHWDKEWYFTKQESDILLLKNINKLLEIFKKNNNYKNFVYDGQTSILDDYLYFEENKFQDIKEAIKKNKLIVGPWYTQPDFFNSTGESIIRNLLVGINDGKKWGNYMNVAYVPDSFGQPEQMPQIYKKFNLNYLIYWRGVTRERIKNSIVHNWVAPDNSTIKSLNFLKGYWVMGQFFPYDKLNSSNVEIMANKFLIDAKDTINYLFSFNNVESLLLPLGGDQAPVNEYLDLFINKLNEIDKENEWIWSTYDDYFNEIKDSNDLPIIKGELKSPETARIHKTIASQRYDIKKALKETDYLIYNQLEPLINFACINNFNYKKNYLNKIIKNLLISNAHDSLGGCNTDKTNRDVLDRIIKSKQWVESIINLIMKEFALFYDDYDLFIFNPRPYQFCTSLSLQIFTNIENFELFDDNGNNINYIILDKNQIKDEFESNKGTLGESTESNFGYYKYLIILPDLKFNGIEFLKIKIKQISDVQNKIIKPIRKNYFENDFWKISINNLGMVDLYNKKLNKEFKNQLEIIFVKDSGDSYDFSPESEDNPIISNLKKTEYELYEYKNFCKINIFNYYEIKNYNDQKVNIELLILNNNLIDIKIKINNLNKNIKVSCVFNSEIENVQNSFANQAFSTIKRNLYSECVEWREKKWVENPIPIETNESFVYLENSNYQFGILTYGNNEYEIIGDKLNKISLTLFRSVNNLGKNNLLWRPGRASGTSDFIINTNDSKMLQNMIFNFRLVLNTNRNKNFWQYANEWTSKPIWYQKQNFNKYIKNFDRFILIPELNMKKINNNIFKIKNNNLICSAFKRTENIDDGYVLRIFNPTYENILFEYESSLSLIYEANLLEEEISSNEVIFIKPYEIKTFIFKNK